MKIALITLSLLLGLAIHAEENNSNQQPSNNNSVSTPSASANASVPGSGALVEDQRPCGLAPGEPITNCPAVKTPEDTEGGTSISVGGNTRPENPKVSLTSVGQSAQKVTQPIVTSKEEEAGSSKKSDTGK